MQHSRSSGPLPDCQAPVICTGFHPLFCQHLCYESYNIILYTVTGFKLGTCTPWRWHINAETCCSNICTVICIRITVHLVGCNRRIIALNFFVNAIWILLGFFPNIWTVPPFNYICAMILSCILCTRRQHILSFISNYLWPGQTTKLIVS
jgi:hypothetical protein